MNTPTEIWYNVFSFLTYKSQGKFSSLWNLHNFSTKEIELIHCSNNLWFNTAKNGYINLMKLLIKAGGVNINIQENDGWTALHWAIIRDRKDCVELLIKSGINVNIQTEYGWTALHYACNYGHKDCVELLIKAGGIDVNVQDEDGDTALYLASYHGHTEIVTLLKN